MAARLPACCCRGKPANTATIVTYTLGFTAAALVGGLAYFYAKRALHTIEQRAQQQDVGVQGVLQSIAINQSRPKSTTDGASMDGGNSDEQGQPMLPQQHRSEIDDSSDSPTMSDDISPTHRRLLQPSLRLAADIKSGSA